MHLLVFVKSPFEATLAQCQVVGLFCQVHTMHMGAVVGDSIKEFMLKCHFINAMLMLCLHSFMVNNGVKKDNCVMQRDACADKPLGDVAEGVLSSLRSILLSDNFRDHNRVVSEALIHILGKLQSVWGL